MSREHEAATLEKQWRDDPRWRGVERGYSAADVVRLRGSVPIEHTLARRGAERLWKTLETRPFVRTLGSLTGNQAVQMAKAGLQAIYLSGWQVAADANSAGQMYPDQSLYPADSAPDLLRAINAALARADQIHHAEGDDSIDWFLPVVADAESGFGGVLNAFELMKDMIDAGAAGVHFEDQLSSAKKCGHMGGKVLVPTREAVQKLIAARLAADVCGVPTLLMARTDALGAKLLTSDVDPNDQPFVTGKRTPEGFYEVKCGMEQAVSRGLAYAPTRTWCGARRRSRTSARRGSSPRRSGSASRASGSPTTARRRSTGGRTSTTPPSRDSRTRWRRWATASSSSPWPASTPSTRACSGSRTAIATAG